MQLSAACQRVAALRATVPSQLTQRLAEHLQQCRPTGDTLEAQQLPRVHALSDGEVRPSALSTEDQHVADFVSGPAREAGTCPDSQTANHGDDISVTPLSPAPADLQSMYIAAVQRMPALRYGLLFFAYTPNLWLRFNLFWVPNLCWVPNERLCLQ